MRRSGVEARPHCLFIFCNCFSMSLPLGPPFVSVVGEHYNRLWSYQPFNLSPHTYTQQTDPEPLSMAAAMGSRLVFSVYLTDIFKE